MKKSRIYDKYCIYDGKIYPVEKIKTNIYMNIDGKKHVMVYISEPMNKYVNISIDNIFNSEKDANNAITYPHL